MELDSSDVLDKEFKEEIPPKPFNNELGIAISGISHIEEDSVPEENIKVQNVKLVKLVLKNN